MEYKIGNRYRHRDGLVIETISLDDPSGHREIVIKGDGYYEVGTIGSWSLIESLEFVKDWTYLGNYSKSSNFDILYNLLND